MQLSESYRARPIRFVEFWEIDEWRLKVYGITYTEDSLDDSLVEAAHDVASSRLRESAPRTGHYEVGFVGIHQGKTGNFVFVDWWADENELHHHVYVSPPDAPAALEYKTPTGLAACVWDLLLIGHERNAWVSNVLERSESPDLEGYLNAILNEDG